MDDMIAGYRLLERLGGGATSDVYRAESIDEPGRIVAVKRLRTDASLDALQRVRREAEALRAAVHPSLVRLLDVVPDGAGVALVLPFLPGGSLADRIARHPDGLPVDEVIDTGRRVAGAMATAHRAGVLHRDLKPANILLDAERQPLITDFGAALVRSAARSTAVGHAIGTAEYLDPAVANGGAPDERADVYALGVVLFEMLVGRPPYAAATPLATLRAADQGEHVPLATLSPMAPPALVMTIERAMARDPEGRPRSMEALVRELERAAPGDARPPSTPDQPDSGTRIFGPQPSSVATSTSVDGPPRWALVGGAVALVLVPVVAFLVLRGGDEPASTPDDVFPTATAAPTPEAPSTPDVVAATPPEPCDGVATPEGAGEIILGDILGTGCGIPVRRDGERLLVPDPDGGPDRIYGLATTDEVFIGDWDCDGTDTLAVYRAAEGVVSTFTAFPQEVGDTITSQERDVSVSGLARHVVVDGCDELRIEIADGA